MIKWQEKIKIKKHRQEFDHYLLTFSDDFNHQIMKENFEIVLDKLISLGKELGFTKPVEYLLLTSTLIQSGVFSQGSFEYDQSNGDIISLKNEQYRAYTIFNGYGVCRHIATFLHLLLDRMMITNSIVVAERYSEENNPSDDLKKIWIDLNRRFQICPPSHHIVNYINDNGLEYIFEFSMYTGVLSYVNQQLCYPFFTEDETNSSLLTLYNCTKKLLPIFNAKTDCETIQPLTVEEELEITADYVNAEKTIKENNDIILRFYQEIQPYCQKIRDAYQQTLERENLFQESLISSSPLIKKKKS